MKAPEYGGMPPKKQKRRHRQQPSLFRVSGAQECMEKEERECVTEEPYYLL